MGWLQEAYIGDGQAEDAFAVVVECGQLLAVLQLLLDPPHLIGNLMCSCNLHMGGEASYHQLWAKEQGIRGLSSPTMPICIQGARGPQASASPSSEGTFFSGSKQIPGLSQVADHPVVK